MKRSLEKAKVSPNFDSKTVTWVGGAHLLILLGLALIPFLSRPKPKDKVLEMVELGSSNPGKGAITGSEKGTSAGGNQNPSKNIEEAPPPPLPIKNVAPPKPPVETPKPEPIEPEVKPEPVAVKPDPVPVKPEPVEPTPVEPKITKPVEPVVKKVEPKKVEPKPTEVKTTKPKNDTPKPKDEPKKTVKNPVKVDLGKTVKRTLPGTPTKASTDGEDGGKEGGVKGGVKEGVRGGVVGSNGTNPIAKGPSASDLKNQLSKGLQSVGVVNGSGSGAAGSPDGSAYHALIKKTLTGNWVKPTAAGGSLEAKVRIRIKPDGSVEPLGISSSSGNKEMDQSILDAVRSTGKFSKPLPEGLGSPDYEVVVNFQLD